MYGRPGRFRTADLYRVKVIKYNSKPFGFFPYLSCFLLILQYLNRKFTVNRRDTIYRFWKRFPYRTVYLTAYLKGENSIEQHLSDAIELCSSKHNPIIPGGRANEGIWERGGKRLISRGYRGVNILAAFSPRTDSVQTYKVAKLEV